LLAAFGLPPRRRRALAGCSRLSSIFFSHRPVPFFFSPPLFPSPQCWCAFAFNTYLENGGSNRMTGALLFLPVKVPSLALSPCLQLLSSFFKDLGQCLICPLKLDIVLSHSVPALQTGPFFSPGVEPSPSPPWGQVFPPISFPQFLSFPPSWRPPCASHFFYRPVIFAISCLFPFFLRRIPQFLRFIVYFHRTMATFSSFNTFFAPPLLFYLSLRFSLRFFKFAAPSFPPFSSTFFFSPTCVTLKKVHHPPG